MNKRFSTLVAAFAAIATVSYAQIGDKYVHLKTSSSTYLTVTKENSAKADSVKLANLGSDKAAKDSALWLPKFVEKMVSGDSVFQFVNKEEFVFCSEEEWCRCIWYYDCSGC